VIGIDVGATKIAGVRVEPATGEVLASARVATEPRRGGGAVLDSCRALVAQLGGGPAGLAVCEVVDPAGRLRSAETVDWREVDLLAEFAAVESDVRAAAMAERALGAGREEPDFLYLSVGSGISHCLVAGGEPRRGVRGAAIGTGAPLVEAWAGGLALARLSGHASAEAALADPAAADVVAEGAARFGQVLASLVNAFDPGALIFGGGLGLHDSYRAKVVAAMRSVIYDPGARELPVLAAALGAEAAAIGAALVAARA
jgi:glucokinase